MHLPAERLSAITSLLEIHTTSDGNIPARLDGITFMRADATTPRVPVIQEPSFVMLARGLKRGYLGGDIYEYSAGQALAVVVPMQFDCDTIVGPEGSMLALAVRIDTALLAELALRMDLSLNQDAGWGLGMKVVEVEEAVADSIERLLRCLQSPMDTRVLGANLVSELHYRLLCSADGGGWAALAGHHGRQAQLRRVIAMMAHRLADDLNVTTMARQAGMSPSAFFQSFRQLTGYSPMQYLKTLRLHRARSLIQEQRFGSAQAASSVGYRSAAQFSRDFKRCFGQSPSAYTKANGGDTVE